MSPATKQAHVSKPYLRSFGRIKGKKLRDNQQRLLDETLPSVSVALREAPDGASLVDLKAQPENYTRIALEIGFGAGEHLLALAKARPDCLCIGAEPFINGVVKLLSGMVADDVSNIRIHDQDVRELLQALPDCFLDDIYVLFPDPWPKAKHHKRRLINQTFFDTLSRVHKPGGVLQFATDHRDYASWMLNELHHTPHYQWQVQSKADWEIPPEIWSETKYQRKTTEQGRSPMFFRCVRVEN